MASTSARTRFRSAASRAGLSGSRPRRCRADSGGLIPAARERRIAGRPRPTASAIARWRCGNPGHRAVRRAPPGSAAPRRGGPPPLCVRPRPGAGHRICAAVRPRSRGRRFPAALGCLDRRGLGARVRRLPRSRSCLAIPGLAVPGRPVARLLGGQDCPVTGQRGPTATRPSAASCRPSIRRRSLTIPSKNAPTMHAPNPAASAAR